jgi:hypothetical protein
MTVAGNNSFSQNFLSFTRLVTIQMMKKLDCGFLNCGTVQSRFMLHKYIRHYRYLYSSYYFQLLWFGFNLQATIFARSRSLHWNWNKITFSYNSVFSWGQLTAIWVWKRVEEELPYGSWGASVACRCRHMTLQNFHSTLPQRLWHSWLSFPLLTRALPWQ